jgi:signal transduction histidine kinase
MIAPRATVMTVTAHEEAALARLAALVADGAPAPEVFAAVVAEAAAALGVPAVALSRYEADAPTALLAGDWPAGGPELATAIHDTRHAAGTRAAAGVPVVIDGTVWGVLCAGAADDDEPLPDGAEEHLRAFAPRATVAISSTLARDRLRRLADGQVALRRLATLIAGGAPSAELFGAVVEEVGAVLGVPTIALIRYEPGRATTAVAALNAPMFPVGGRWPLDGPSVAATILDTGRPARFDDYSDVEGTIGERMRKAGVRSAVGVPIVVDGGIWGFICVAAPERLPAGIETELRDFTELVGVAIAGVESRARPRRLAEQQASLRRVATLVAKGAEPAALFSAVAEEVARILDVSAVSVARFEPDHTSVVVASVKDPGFPVGSRWPLDGESLNAMVHATGQPARIDDYAGLEGPVAAAARASGMHSGVGVPIVVDGSVWGMVAVGRRQRREALPSFAGRYTGTLVLSTESSQEIETRLAAFTELVATAISKAQANDDLRRLAEEQAALRRVATLVAEAAPPEDIFDAVTHEVATILGLPRIEMVRYERDGTGTVIGASGDHPFPVGSNWALDGPSIMAAVLATGRPARIDDYGALGGTIAEVARGAGFRSAIGAPIIVDGAMWGTIIAISTVPEPIPERSETRLRQFTELVATAVSNATARADLLASRARIVTAGDEARRRLERNLHDGTQQRLIAIGLDLQRIRAMLPEDQGAAQAGLEQAESDLEATLEEVREVSRGLHPAQLSRGGLGLALAVLARRSPIAVELDIDVDERPPPPIETAVYYVVSEALTNAIKHSSAAAISVRVASNLYVVHARIADDGAGGAVADSGSGLSGLNDRVEALGGRFVLESPPGRGTAISIELPMTTPGAP